MPILKSKNTSPQFDILWDEHRKLELEIQQLDKNIETISEEEVIRMEQLQSEVLWITEYLGNLHPKNDFRELITRRFEELKSTTLDLFSIQVYQTILARFDTIPN